MKNKKVSFENIWEVIKIPSYVMIAWSILGLVLFATMTSLQKEIQYFSWIVLIIVFGLVGHYGIKAKFKLGQIAKSGAYCGAITGLFGAVLNLIVFLVYPAIFQQAILEMTAAGLSPEQAKNYFQFSMYFGIVIGPLFSAAMGALVSFIAGYLLKED